MNPKKPDLRARLQKLGLYGLLAHWDELSAEPWIERLLAYEEDERQRRSLERRIRNAKLGGFKSIADFEWNWPKKIDRQLIEEILELHFIEEAANVVLIGPNGVGKTTIALNIAYQAILRGYTVRHITASELLNELAAQDGTTALTRRLRCFANPQLLLIDEVGYLSYDSRHGDLLFEIVTRRHENKSIVLTTNKPFGEWNQVFPNSSCVTALIDRLVHRAEIVQIDGDSYRLKEAKERTARREQSRNKARSKRKP